MQRHPSPKNHLKWLLYTAAIFFALIFLITVPYLVFAQKYDNKIFSGVKIGELNLSGLTREQARSMIEGKINNINENGIIFNYNEHKKTFFPMLNSMDADLAIQLINFDLDQTITSAFGYGRTGNFWRRLTEQTRSWIFDQSVNLFFSIDNDQFKKFLKNEFKGYETPAQNAEIKFENGNQVIKKEQDGHVINYDQAISELEKNLASINIQEIKLSETIDHPHLYKNDLLGAQNRINEILSLAPVILKYPTQDINGNKIPAKKKTWSVAKTSLADWITTKDSSTDENNKQIEIVFDPNRIKEYLDKKVAPDVNKKMNDARFQIQGGKVAQFQSSQDGLEIEASSTIEKITKAVLENNQKEVELSLIGTKSNIKAEDVNNLGIKEIIGTGQSNFVGSPSNRRHNIRIGAYTVNGLLIKPGQEFSLMRALGHIDESGGYLPELVIKDNKTQPEFGGGLCQIGTTMFRAAIASGLPITQRRNHSYRVAYYEPAGTDATIYDPQPDLRFINDTNDYILIQTRISGNSLYFDLWGTRDGRQTSHSYPTIYNIVKPEPTKIVETLDLPVGKKKCTEHAHNGADAYFDYKVIYPGGNTKSHRFSSHYVPWREVCLLGVNKLNVTNINESAQITASSTSSTTNTSSSSGIKKPDSSNKTNNTDGKAANPETLIKGSSEKNTGSNPLASSTR